MIRVDKSTVAAPVILTTKGVPASNQFCTDHDANPAAYRRQKKGASTKRTKFPFSSAVYGHETVRAVLRALQHDKCAFCESDMMAVGFGDVEHFRPKGAWQQREGDPLRYPGYFWLVYEWDNLFLSCTLCNQRYKKNLFPLRVQRNRADPVTRDLSKEAPLLLAPSDHPEKHITYIGEIPVPVNRSVRGRKTIEIFELDTRDEIIKRRRTLRAHLLGLQKSRELLAERADTPEVIAHINRLDQLLTDATLASAEYAAMARAFLG